MSTQPDPANFPSYRSPSEKDGPAFVSAAHRAESGWAFRTGAQTYDAVRPSYPPAVTELLAKAHTVVDIGAGTGKFTEALSNPVVLACDPSPDMVRTLRARLKVPVWQAIAEATALRAQAVDAAVIAQTWHWVDAEAACSELDRIVRPGGIVVLAWNTLDVRRDPWILRLARIMHSGDIQRPGFVPPVQRPWRIDVEVRTGWEQKLSTGQIHQLMHSRSYWLKSSAAIRERMTGNLNWYLFEHMGFAPSQLVEIPYRTDAFVLRRE